MPSCLPRFLELGLLGVSVDVECVQLFSELETLVVLRLEPGSVGYVSPRHSINVGPSFLEYKKEGERREEGGRRNQEGGERGDHR